MNIILGTLVLIIFVQALVLSWVLTYFAIGLGSKWGFIDYPDERKVHDVPKPRFGGAAIWLASMLVFIVNTKLLWMLNNATIMSDYPLLRDVLTHWPGVTEKLWQLLGILLGGLVIFVGGLLDDHRNLSPRWKLVWQITAAVILISFGVHLTFRAPGFVPQWVVTWVLSMLWVVFAINSINFLDNMDGLASGITVILCFFLIVLSWLGGELFITLFVATVMGATLGYMYFNRYPSRILMGDSGSMFLGYMLASVTFMSTYYRPEHQSGLSLLTPIIVWAVPLYDMVVVIIIRLHERRPIYVGDKCHFSHRLVELGMSTPAAVRFIYLTTLFTGLGALMIRWLTFAQGVVVLAQVLLVLAMLWVLEHAGRSEKP